MTIERLDLQRGLDGERIRSSFRAYGVVRLAGALSGDLAERFYAAAQALFAVPNEHKELCRRRGMSGGFTPPGVEGVRAHGPDFRRCFWDTLDPEGEGNRYPDTQEGSGYASAAAALFRHVEATVLSLLHAAYPEVAALAHGGRHLLRASRYEPAPREEVVFPSHVDFGLVTAYVGGAMPGLQGLIDDAWTDLVAEGGGLLVGTGTTLRLYDPVAVPLRHRVVGAGAPPARISAVFFAEPRGDVVLPNGRRAADHLADLVSQIRHEP